MTAIASYLVVQDCEGSPSDYWEASYSQSTGNNLNFLVYGGAAPVAIPFDVNYLDVRDCEGSPVDTWYVNSTSTDSGNNLNIYFYTSPVVDVQIYGSGSMVANGVRFRSIFDSIVGLVDASASGVAIYSRSASVTGSAEVVAQAGRQTNGDAAITGNGSVDALGKILGEEWSDVPKGSEVWRET
jgi:hypothetical protein